jgi:hypothetical protein
VSDLTYGPVHNINQSTWYWEIMPAIEHANDGDIIEVAPGTYEESIDFMGKAITVRSTDPNNGGVVEATIINANCDANNIGRVVTFDDGEDANSILTGFTITGGYSVGDYPDDVGGGIFCLQASPAISNCVICNNYGFGGGGMLNFDGSSPKLTNCIFTENESYFGGGVLNSTNSNVTLFNCTFSKNSSSADGGGMFNYLSSPVVTNCIFWGNDAGSSGDEIYNYSSSSDPNFSYCDIEGCKPGGVWDPNFGTDLGGNIDSDPLFVDDTNDDYHLDPNSSCIDIGDSNGTYTGELDIDGDNRVIDVTGKGDGIVDVDMGADEYDPNS